MTQPNDLSNSRGPEMETLNHHAFKPSRIPSVATCVFEHLGMMCSDLGDSPRHHKPVPQSDQTGDLKEFLSVCGNECDHPFCWSQKTKADQTPVDPCEMNDKQYENYIYGAEQTGPQKLPPRPRTLQEDQTAYADIFHSRAEWIAYAHDLEAELSSLRSNVATAVESLEELGLPVRERYGHWSAWQYKVKLHRDILALLRPPLKEAQEDGQ
jgi:hypothetical protein